MKFNLLNLLKSLLRKWFIVVIAAVIGVGLGLYSAFNTTLKTEYVGQVYINQDFAVKNPEPGVNYPDSVSSLTESLMNNSLVAIKNSTYLEEICSKNGINTSQTDYRNLIEVKLVSENIIQIHVKFANADLSKAVCQDIMSGLSVHLNKSILNNIDPQTGDFYAGTPNSNKIIVTEFMKPTKYVEGQTQNWLKIALYGCAFAMVSVLVLIIIDLLRNKVNKASSIRAYFDIPVDDAESCECGIRLAIANNKIENVENKIFTIFSGQLKEEELEGFYRSISNNRKVLVIEVGEKSGGDGIVQETSNLHRLCLSNDNLTNIESILNIKNEKINEYEFIFINVLNGFKNEDSYLYSKLTENVIICAKNNKDSVWDLCHLIGKMKDNNVKVERIICV